MIAIHHGEMLIFLNGEILGAACAINPGTVQQSA
jgi:hypothetical protein